MDPVGLGLYARSVKKDDHKRPDILCIGSVLWDVIGRTDRDMALGNDKPGQIARLPGGVALNIAVSLARFGWRPALLSVIGEDGPGRELCARCEDMSLKTEYMLRDPALPTDQYMAIEAQGEMIAAIADARSLETVGARVLAPLEDGRLGSAEAPWSGPLALDGNLTAPLLADIAGSPLFAAADLRLAPASPGKIPRLRPYLTRARTTLYLNREEAGLLLERSFDTAGQAAAALVGHGAARVLVTDGPREAASACDGALQTACPKRVEARRVTGAGDTFMAAHITAEARGADGAAALHYALDVAAHYVSEKT